MLNTYTYGDDEKDVVFLGLHHPRADTQSAARANKRLLAGIEAVLEIFVQFSP